jgi:hypothetical protein
MAMSFPDPLALRVAPKERMPLLSVQEIFPKFHLILSVAKSIPLPRKGDGPVSQCGSGPLVVNVDGPDKA